MDIQGHRGCRGLRPENTIPAFLLAIDLGVNTLEMDAVISGDGQVIISHEPFMNHEMCLDRNGKEISEINEIAHNIYKMKYDSLKSYDCGIKEHPRFIEQEKITCYKPSLNDVVAAVNRKLISISRKDIFYNIEIKRKAKWDFTHHPPYQEFADLVINSVKEKGISDFTTIQCFDFDTLRYINRKYPKVKLVMLIEDKRAPEKCIEVLGFIPEVYSPFYKLVDSHLVDYCTKLGMKLIPWTVNNTEDIREMIDLGVTGIISDYPDRVINIINDNYDRLK